MEIFRLTKAVYTNTRNMEKSGLHILRDIVNACRTLLSHNELRFKYSINTHVLEINDI